MPSVPVSAVAGVSTHGRSGAVELDEREVAVLGIGAARGREPAHDLGQVDPGGVVDRTQRQRRGGPGLVDLDPRLDRGITGERADTRVGVGEHPPDSTAQPRQEVQPVVAHWSSPAVAATGTTTRRAPATHRRQRPDGGRPSAVCWSSPVVGSPASPSASAATAPSIVRTTVYSVGAIEKRGVDVAVTWRSPTPAAPLRTEFASHPAGGSTAGSGSPRAILVADRHRRGEPVGRDVDPRGAERHPRGHLLERGPAQLLAAPQHLVLGRREPVGGEIPVGRATGDEAGVGDGEPRLVGRRDRLADDLQRPIQRSHRLANGQLVIGADPHRLVVDRAPRRC